MRLTRNGLLTTLLVIVALLVGSTLTRHLPDPNEFRDAPYPVAGVLGEPVRLRTGEITLTGVRSARTVEIFGNVAATTGVWLVVDVTYEPLHEPGLMAGSQARVEALDGRQFGGLQPVTNNCGPANPGLPVACQLPFEVDDAALEGLVLAIPALAENWGADHVTAIDLGITAERAEELRASEDHVVLLRPRVVER